jgi:hypothetical protein
MSKVGHFVTDPANGVYCHITLDGGDKILVSHDKGSFESGHLAVERSKWMGLSSERLFSLDLDTEHGRAAMRRLTAGADAGSAWATPLGALVEYVKDCRTADEVKQRGDALFSERRAA